MSKQYLLPRAVIIAATVLFISSPRSLTGQEIKVGSKSFTESVVLGELVTLLIQQEDIEAQHRRELGGTEVVFSALTTGEIDIYAEYTGTIRKQIFSDRSLPDHQALRKALAEFDIKMSEPLGFSNQYALGLKSSLAESKDISTVSDLRKHPELNFAFSNEFMNRDDAWPGLRIKYQLPQEAVGMQHDLAYRAIDNGSADVMDLYSTDAEIDYYDLRVLEDDLEYFPRYDAVLLYRKDTFDSRKAMKRSVLRLEQRISPQEMIRLNKRAKIDRVPEALVAAEFLEEKFNLDSKVQLVNFWGRLQQTTISHLMLVGVSLGAAIIVAIPLGIFAAKVIRFSQLVLGITGIIQTIPSLALLVFMIPLLGIGFQPAVAALFLYSLLPIVRNTYTGIHDIPRPFKESAAALGLSSWASLRLIELPMASRAILAGIKTSAVINVGTATLGALIGAGGYGQPILTGIRLNDPGLIMEGAVPAAVLALLVQYGFELSERIFVPAGLRIKRQLSK